MPQHRSIAQRLKKTKKMSVKLEIITDWATGWENDQMQLIKQLEAAIKSKDFDTLCIATGQLKAVTQKRFEGFASIIEDLQLPAE